MDAIQSVHTFEGHTGRIFSLAVCCLPDGRRWAASACHDRTIRIWNLNTMQHFRTIQYSDFVWRVFIVKLPRPCVVAFISAESKIQISDLESGETLNSFNGRLIFSGTVSIFPRPVIVTAEGEEDISFIDIVSGETLKTICGGFDKMFRAVVTNAPDPLLVFTTWNTQTRRSTIQSYLLERDMIEGASTSGKAIGDDCDTETALTAGRTNAVAGSPRSQSTSISTTVSKEKMTLLFEGDSRDGVTSLVITQGGSRPRICSGHYDFMVRLWSIETKELLMVLEGHADYVGAVACWKGSLPIVVSGSSDGTIKAWNTQTGALIATGEGHTRDAWALGITDEPNARIVSGSFDRTVRVWDLGPVLQELNWQRRKAFCLFLYRLGYIEHQDNSAAVLLEGGGQGVLDEKLIQKVFCTPPLIRTIASFL